MDLSKVSRGDNVPYALNVIIEIPAHSEPVKYEMDKETGALVKNQYGKGKDGMSVTLTMLDTGGVGDDAFLPPQGVSFTGP